MRTKLLTLLLIVLLAFSYSCAQDKQSFDKYSTIEFKQGFPTLYTGKKAAFEFEKPQFGTVNPGDAFIGVYILVDNSSPKNPRYWFLLEKNDSTFSLGGLRFDDYEADVRNAKMNFLVSSNATYTYPIEFIYAAKEDQFYYKWIGSDEENIPQPVKNKSKLLEGKQIPNFSVELLNGENFELSQVKDKILVINWWSTSCAPCIAEIPGFNKLVEKYESNDQILFLAIAWDSKQRVNSFLERKPFLYEHALYNDEVVDLFGAAFPRNLVINNDRTVAYNELGANEKQWEKIDQVIQLLTSTGNK